MADHPISDHLQDARDTLTEASPRTLHHMLSAMEKMSAQLASQQHVLDLQGDMVDMLMAFIHLFFGGEFSLFMNQMPQNAVDRFTEWASLRMPDIADRLNRNGQENHD